MIARRLPGSAVALAAVVSVVSIPGRGAAQYGVVLTGAGAPNRGFGGVATAAPLSPAGAMFWNPATLSGFERSELETGAELLWPQARLMSSLPANAFGPGVPAGPLAGTTTSDRGVFPLPTIGLALVPNDSRLRLGLGVFALAGFGLDYAGSTTNPLLMAPPPNGFGVGPVYSQYQVLQIAPAVAYQLTPRLSVAAGPTLNLATLTIDPALFGAPDDANGNGFATYPPGNHARTAWGGGFVVGSYYRTDDWGLGVSFKSPQWFETFRYNSQDELGRPRALAFNLNLPLIVSAGASYTGFKRLLLATDVRFLNYAGAAGFGNIGFAPNGAINGLGWKNMFAVAAGAQYQLTDALAVRAGYSFGDNPIPGGQSLINAASPTVIEHTFTTGASWQVSDLTLSAAYGYGVNHSIQGPFQTPAGNIPGSLVRNSANVHFVVFGMSVKFGRPRDCGACAPAAADPAAPSGYLPARPAE